MAYIRIKWIKGHPYLYEQESYRVGPKVRTKHIRYVGKFSFTNSSGFQAPKNLNRNRKHEIDAKIAELKLSDNYPYEREILRQYLYHHKYPFEIGRIPGAWGQVTSSVDTNSGEPIEVKDFKLRRESTPYTWMHEMGHSLEDQDHILDAEIKQLRKDFGDQLKTAYETAMDGGLAEKEVFINAWGPLIDIRVDFGRIYTRREDVDRDTMSYYLEEAKDGLYRRSNFNRLFKKWVNAKERIDKPQEIFADTVASLIINPKRAFDTHTAAGKKYVAKVYVKLFTHIEKKYKISLGRPKKIKEKK